MSGTARSSPPCAASPGISRSIGRDEPAACRLGARRRARTRGRGVQGPGRIFTAADLLSERTARRRRCRMRSHVVNLCHDRYAVHDRARCGGAARADAACSRVTSRPSSCGRSRTDSAASARSRTNRPSRARCAHLHLDLAVPGGRPGAEANPELPTDRLVAIVFTSGSTGEPVGSRKTWGELAARSAAAASRFGCCPARPRPSGHGAATPHVRLRDHDPAAAARRRLQWCGPLSTPRTSARRSRPCRRRACW